MTTPVRQTPVVEGDCLPAGVDTLRSLTRFDYSVNAALLLSFVAQQTGDVLDSYVLATTSCGTSRPNRVSEASSP